MLELGKEQIFKGGVYEEMWFATIRTLACTAVVRERGGGVASERGVEADGGRGVEADAGREGWTLGGSS